MDVVSSTHLSDVAPPHVILRALAGSLWDVVGVSPGLKLSSEPFAIEDSALPKGRYLSASGLRRILKPVLEDGILGAGFAVFSKFYCCYVTGVTEQRTVAFVGVRSWGPFAKRKLRSTAKALSREHLAHVTTARAAMLKYLADFSTRYFDGSGHVRSMLEVATSLLNCRAVSLWVYNKLTNHLTLYGHYNVDRSLYTQDWISADSKDWLMSKLLAEGEDIVAFRPNPKRSVNPQVAALFPFGFMCKLKNQSTSSILGVLNVYEARYSPEIRREERLALVSSATRDHLFQIRQRNRNNGVRLASEFFSKAAGSTLAEALDWLCCAITERLDIGGCSVFLAEDWTANRIRLVSTSDIRYPEFVKKHSGRWWHETYSYRRGEGLTGAVLVGKDKTPRVIYDLPAFEDENTHIYDEITADPHKSWIGVPIVCPREGITIGVLRAVNKLISRDGKLVPWHFLGSDVETLKNFATIIGYIWDNYELQEQSELRLEEAQAQRDEKSQFLDSLGHEIIAPLQPLKNIITLLRKDPWIKKAGHERLHYYLEAGDCQLGQMEMTATNIASLTNPQTMVPEEIQVVGEIIHPVVDLFRLQAKVDKDVEITFDPGLWESPRVRIDPRVARQVLFVLLHNAFKYSNEDTTIYITGEIDRSAQEFLISVQDTGLEIPKGWEAKVFDRGVRGPDVKEQLFPGCGLGLTIGRQLAMAAGARLYVARTQNPVELVFAIPIA